MIEIVSLIDEDFVNYKKAAMVIGFPKCSFKCDKECGQNVCQNSELANSKTIKVSIDNIINRYLNNSITSAIVFQGLEPFDSFNDLYSFIYEFIKVSNDDIVIYTGYNENEIEDKVKDLKNIVKDNTLIIKFGRFIPDHDKHYDEVLGVKLASDNQYAKII